VGNANEGTDGIMKLAPDGSACAEVIEMKGIYSVEHEGAFLLCGMKDGSAVVVLDDASYESVATIPLPEDYGDRVTRMLVIHDVLFVADAGSDSNNTNAVHAAPLSADGQAFFDELVANLSGSAGDETEAPTEAPTDTPDADTEAPTEALDETTAAPEADTDAPLQDTEAPTDAPAETDPPKSGCGSSLGFAAAALLSAVAAFVACRRD
jgi:hypothetical protein